MRHGVRELRRHACRRRYRVLSRGDDPALSVSPNLASVWVFLAKPSCPAKAGHPVVTAINFGHGILDHPSSRVMTTIGISTNAPPPQQEFRPRRLAASVACRRDR